MAKRILVIDDDIMSLKMAAYILHNDYDVVCAKTGREGLEILRRCHVDLLLLDIIMPEMTGLEVLKEIHEDSRISSVKTIILSSSGMEKDVVDAVNLGAVDYVKKPFFSTELLERIKKVLQVEVKDSILVVDDDKMNLMMTKKALGGVYDVHCVSSGKDALEYLKKNVVDLILLDLHMPIMNGLEVMGKIKEMEEMEDVPVVFLTADNEVETEIEIFKTGAMDFIRKPFSAEVVMRRISRILEQYHYKKFLQVEIDKKTRELREKNIKYINLTTQVMTTLASAIDAKDTYTKGHSVRVAQYSSELARRMGKDVQEINDIYYIALLHDIGKIGIDDRIINKPGRLSEEEYECMKVHPKIGADILENICEMPNISHGAHWHHERYDGSGYPDGLRGEEIPEVARIIGVADAYDAMTSNRSYRKLMPQHVVKSELTIGSGRQFDPVIAKHMIDMIEEDTEYQLHG